MYKGETFCLVLVAVIRLALFLDLNNLPYKFCNP